LYFNEAERLDPRNVKLLSSHAGSYIMLRRFPEALRKLEQVLNITPDDVDTIVLKAGIAQAEGDLPRASALLAPLRPAANLHHALQTQVYQAILERSPGEIIPRLKEILAQPDPALGFYNGELRFYLGWAQEVAGDQAAAQESWQQARNELEPFLKEQPENYHLLGDLALTNMGLGDKGAALSLAERAMAVIPVEKDPMDGPWPLEIFARVAGRMGEPDRAITALEKLLSIPYEGPLATTVVPLTPALLRLDPMFDPLRGDLRFQKLVAGLGPVTTSPAPAVSEKSVAVLPFLDLSPGKDQEYFCDGISEEILNTLAKVEGLQVAARTSSFSFKGTNLGVKEIAGKLGVRHLLEGSLRREGNRIRITAQLINATDGFHLWSETYERELQGAAVAYLSLGLHDEAIAEGKRTLQLDPNYIYETPILADVYREKGMFAEAIALFLKAQQITGAPQPGLAVTYARMGRTAEARQILAELKDEAAKKYIAAEEIAAVYASLGEKDEAFKWLDQACDDHGGAVQAIPIRPVFRSLHSDPRFRAIVRRMGLDPAAVLDHEKSP